MGHPTHDPHGDPIPSHDLSLPTTNASVPLPQIPAGQRGTLVRVGAQDPDDLDHLRRLGLAPGSTVEVVSDEKRGLRIQVGEDRFLLPTSLAEALWIEKVKQ